MKYLLYITILSGLAALSGVTMAGEVSSGEVTGIVINEAGMVPFSNVTVAIYSLPDSSITRGVATDSNGYFKIDNLPEGDYNLVITFIGYKSRSIRFALSEGQNTLDVGEIILSESAEDIGSVNVVAIKPQIIYRDNKKILNVSEFQNAGASTLTEVLENAPSVTLDSEGNVLLRGSGNFTLLIDGKPVPGAGVNILKQIPAEMVEDVEIMTNPSAKYDPDGVAGIINLVLKKQTEAGINGQIALMAGLREKYNSDIQINYRKGKVNLFTGLSATSYKTEVNGTISRETVDGPDINTVANDLSQSTKIGTIMGNTGIDYTINDRNSLTLSARYGPQRVNAIMENNIFREDPDPGLSGNFLFNNEINLSGFMYAPNIAWDHKFKSEGEKIQINIFTGGFRGSLKQEITEEAADINWNGTDVITDNKRLENEMFIDDIRTKADYEKQFGEKGKIEIGYQYRVLFEKNNHQLQNYEIATGNWVTDDSYTNNFILNRDIHSIYSTWGSTKGKYSYQIGLRGEYTHREVKQETGGEVFPYSKFNIFPSANISKKVSEKTQMQISYSRRINRPSRNQLNPFEQYADNQLLIRGNPNLNPEFIDSYEFSLQNQVKIGSLSAEAYYRRVNNVINNFLSPGEDGIIYQEFINSNRSHTAGAEFMANIQPVGWLRIISSANIYYYLMDDKDIYSGNDIESFEWNGNLTAVFLPTKTTRMTVAGIYNGPSISLQGTTFASYMVNLGLRQEILKSKASLSLGVRDLFASFVIQNRLMGEDFSVTTKMRPETRVVTLTFAYNLNNYRRRSDAEDMELNFIR
jgi:outer membrane receptor protein involved in Fe transport